MAEIAAQLSKISLADDGSPSLTALSFASDAHHLDGDFHAAREALGAALDRASDESDQQDLTGHLLAQGRPSECVARLESWLTDMPDDPQLTAWFEYSIEEIHRRLTTDPPGDECPCGADVPWATCCKERDAETLAQFSDRSAVTSLHSAMRVFLPGSAYQRPVAEHIDEWLDVSDAVLWDDGAQRAIGLLAAENAWLTAGLSDDDEDDDRDNPLDALCESATTGSRLKAHARTWYDEARSGLWQVDRDPSAGPPTGLSVTELCTGQSLYVSIPERLKPKLARWSVLLGAVVPLDGAWRFTSATIAVSPNEADSLIETVQAATHSLIHALSGTPMHDEPPEPAPPGRAAPHSIYAYEDDQEDESLARVINRVVGSLLPRLLGDVHHWRSTPPAMTNTDGEPMQMISARIAVTDMAVLIERLSSHPDFNVLDDSRVTWLGREVPAARLESMLADLEAEHGPIGTQTEEPQRWVRASMTASDGQLRVEVNSRERLGRLVDVLDELGADPVVVDESRIDPRQDLPWPAGHRVLPGGAAPASEGWEKHWLDENVPALGGSTPREAAEGEFRPHLERMLRQFEFEADMCRFAGKKGIDTDWLRDALDMAEHQLHEA